MKKEVLIAILIGFGIGLLITFGIYQAQKAYQQAGQPAVAEIPDTAATPQPTPFSGLSITSPLDSSVQSENTVFITGTATANSFITIVTNEAEIIDQATPRGDFSIQVELTEGANLIKVTAIDQAGISHTQDFTIFYQVSESINQTATDTEDNE